MDNSFNKTLRILIVEGAPTDAMLLELELKNGGINFNSKLVDTREDYLKALKDFSPDIILSDYMLPNFDGMAALQLRNEMAPDIPFIIVTGSTNEEIAVECIKAGADDYITKDRPLRLVPCVKNALQKKVIEKEKKKAEEALRESEEKYRILFEMESDALFLIDNETGWILETNQAAVNIYGYSREELLSKHNFDLSAEPDDTRKATRERWKKVPTRWHRRKDGTVFPVEITATHLNLEGHDVHLAAIRDITEQKLVEETLKRVTGEWRTTFDSMTDLVMLLDDNHRIIRANKAMAEMLKMPFDKIVGSKCWEAAHKTDAPPDPCPFSKKNADYGKKQSFEIFDENLKRYFLVTTTPHFDDSGAQVGFVHVMRDITELKKLEEQFLHAQKMEAIGTLAGGIAHDFNNLLAIILSYSHFVSQELKEGDSMRSDIEEIIMAGERGAALIRQLLTFSRKQMLEPKIFKINQVVTNMEKLLRRIIGEDVDLKIVLDPELGLVKADQTQIEQVIMNLVVNARDAMPKGGKLSIETNNVLPDDRYVGLHASVEPGNYVMISVSDTGHGMDSDTKRKIFEPFFTTKEIGKGTGLGLSTVYGIVKQSNGHIWVSSEPGRGATFKIYLPRILEKIKSDTMKQPIQQSLQGSETVLLVEDDDSVRKAVRRVLKNAGYHVLEASSGKQAMKVARDHTDVIQLVITDVVMPGMSGRDLAERLAPANPNAKVLYMSGYIDNAIVHHGILDPNTHFIQKPFKPQALLRRVREVLDSGL